MIRKDITIVLDLDDVITPFVPTLIEKYNKYFNTYHTIEEIKDWNTPNEIFNPPLWDITRLTNVLEVIPLKENAYETIEKWYNSDYKIFIATACSGYEYIQKLKWLENTGLDKFIKELIPIKNKYLLKADVFVDDYIENLKPFHENQKEAICVLMEAQHNKCLAGTKEDKFIRVRDWVELSKWVDLIIQK